MDRNRLILRLVLIAVVIGVFWVRRGHYSPKMVTGLAVALAFALTFTVVRAVLESKKQKQLEQDKQLAAKSKNVELFTKPKDS